MRKLSVITGAASGIGAALVAHAQGLGHCVIACDIDEAALAGLDDADLDNPIDKRILDVTDAAAFQSLIDDIVKTYGAVDYLFNNAGIMYPGTIGKQDLVQFRQLIEVNFFGVLNGVYAVLPHMQKRATAAHIINTASIAGLVTSPLFAAYNASKHAVVALSETLAYELDESPIDVSVICPGPVATNIMQARDDQVSDEIKGLMHAMHKRTNEIGMPPAALAKFIFEEIAKGQFWILPHADQLHRIPKKAEAIITRTNPKFEAW